MSTWALLIDGELSRIAPLTWANRAAVERLHHNMSPDNQYLRVPELVDLDLNPVLASATGTELIDVKVRLAPRTSYDPFLRRLR